MCSTVYSDDPALHTCLAVVAGEAAETSLLEPGTAAAAAQAVEHQPAAAAAAAEDDEFDYSAELEAASVAIAAADTTDAADGQPSPQQSPRSPMLPPPPPVDDSAAHIKEYLSTVCEALLETLPDGALPAWIQPAQVCGVGGVVICVVSGVQHSMFR